jgi:hypothetical protein
VFRGFGFLALLFADLREPVKGLGIDVAIVEPADAKGYDLLVLQPGAIEVAGFGEGGSQSIGEQEMFNGVGV